MNIFNLQFNLNKKYSIFRMINNHNFNKNHNKLITKIT